MVTAGVLRIAFFGTPEFAAPSLETLHRSRHQIAAVVTQPDRARGRGQKPQAGAIAAYARAQGLTVLQPDRLRDPAFLAALHALHLDLGVVAAYGKLLTDEVLAAPRLGLINVHASLLPRYRGAAPVHRAVMAGEVETGVTIMRVVKALDAGPMMATAVRPISDSETSADIERALAVQGASVLMQVVEELSAGTARETPQDDAAASYAPKIVKADGIVDWERSARAIHNQIRGLHPWPHAFADLRGERIILHRSTVEPASAAEAGSPGTILPSPADTLRVQTGDGVLGLLLLQREGRRPVSARELMAGYRDLPGSRFERTSLAP